MAHFIGISLLTFRDSIQPASGEVEKGKFAMFDKTQLKMDSLKRHLGLLDMMLERNEAWIIQKAKPEISQAHQKMIDLIQQTRTEYLAMLELYANANR